MKTLVERLAGFQYSENDMDEFSHGRAKGNHLGLSGIFNSRAKRNDDWVVSFGRDGRHVEQFAKPGAADLGHSRFALKRSGGLLPRNKTGKSH